MVGFQFKVSKVFKRLVFQHFSHISMNIHAKFFSFWVNITKDIEPSVVPKTSSHRKLFNQGSARIV